MPDIGRNDPCPCGSGKKYKKCCADKDQAKQHAEMEKQWNKSVKDFEKQKKAEEAKGEATDEKNPGQTAKPTSHPTSSTHTQRHNIPVAPKFNMPRKAGGGG